MTLRIKAPLVVARNEDGAFVHLYGDNGQTEVPEGLDKDDVERLVAEGYFFDDEADDADKHIEEARASHFRPTVVDEADAAESTKVERPAGNASLEDWQAYARSKGASDRSLESATRDDLREKYSK
jgi:hypothetical protein